MKIHQLFPLAVGHDHIALDSAERDALVSHVLDSADSSDPQNRFAWTGDTEGREFLFAEPVFADLAARIAEKIRLYLQQFAINLELLDLYYQRSWATISANEQSIAMHDHAQSNLSFAYYLKKAERAGGTLFKSAAQPNEFAKDIYNPDKHEKGLIAAANALNAKQALIDGPEGTLLIFPSSALHSTVPNQSGEPRITLAGDITIMLKDSRGFEHIMPNFKHWTAL